MAAILRSALSMSAATTLSRITGYARTMTQAATLGTGVVANAYTLSNMLPTQIYELFMGGILASIFVPLLVERLTRRGEEDARRLTNALLTLMLPFLGVVALLGIVFAEPLVALTTAWGPAEDFSRREAQEATSLAVLLFRAFALQILFYGIGTLATGVLNSHRRFFLPTFAPVLNNLIVIASFGAYALLAGESPTAAIYTLAFGTTLGIAAMALALIPTMWRLGYKPRPRVGHPALLAAARLAAPMLVLVAASVGVQVAAYFIGTAFNAAPQLYYAFTIFSLPYGVFVVAIATALMPELSEKFSRGDAEGYRDTLSFGLRLVAFVAIPSTVGLVVLAEPIIALLYERGEFGPRATQEVAALLVAYSVGLLAAEHQDARPPERLPVRPLRRPGLRSLARLRGDRGRARALRGQRRSRPPGARGDEEGDQTPGRAASPALSSQDPRGRSCDVRRRLGRGSSPRGRLGYLRADPRYRRRRGRLARGLPRGGAPAQGRRAQAGCRPAAAPGG
jgi:putative peptidoglycan lipid II flippase